MRAWRLSNSTANLILSKQDIPVPGPGEITIRVRAAGVTPTELNWYPTTHGKDGQKRDGAVPGHEFSGVIAAAGAGVIQAAVGQEVYGMNDWFADGATADYCLTRPEWIAPKPNRLTHTQAASVPIGALTAWQGLLERAKLQAGERILIHGGSGAVGVFATQLAHRQGAHVTTTASARNRDFLLKLGADRVLDYRTEEFEKSVNEVDVVFDTVGGATLQRSWSVLSSSGRLVTIATGGDSGNEKTKNAFFIVEPNRAQLLEVGHLLENGELETVVDAAVPFAHADEAYAGKIQRRFGRGKVVVVVED